MAEKIQINVDLGELKDFTPTEGLGSNSLMKMDGTYCGKVLKILPRRSESSGNPMWLVQLIVEDEDEKGASLLQNVLLGGKDRNGDSLARQLGQFLTSVGYTTEQIRGFAAKGVVDGEQLGQAFIGKLVYFTAEAESYEGKMTSKVKNFVTKQNYDDAKAANAHRKPHNAAVSFSGPPAGIAAPANVGGPAANVGGPAATAGANGAAKPNPLQALQGLNLNI